MTCHSNELTLPTVTDVGSLCYPLPVWPLTSALVQRTARRGRAGRYDPLISATAWQCQRIGAQHGAIPIATYYVSRARAAEKEGLATLKDFLCLSFSFFLPL